MGTRNRKIRKLRGSRTHGWGISGQHRGIGMRGGHGKAGLFKHKWTYVLRYGLPRKGKHGFTSLSKGRKLSTINMRELDDIVDNLLAEGKVKEKEGKINIDLSVLGCEKLLGGGRISKPLEIKVMNCSGSALKKVEEAGGSIVSSTKEKTKGEASSG